MGGMRRKAARPHVVVKHRSTAAGAVEAFVAWAVQSTQGAVLSFEALRRTPSTLYLPSPRRGERGRG